MIQEQAIVKKRRRVPKPGTGFMILLVLGIIMMVTGALIIVGSAIGLIVILVRIGPDLVDILPHVGESQMGGFVAILMLTWVCIPLVTGLIGVFMAAMGFVFYRLATTRSIT
jgi:hypothetical protein